MKLAADKIWWLAGVMDAAGKLYISFTRTPSRRPAYRVTMEFRITVPKEDAVVVDRLRDWLGEGRVDIYQNTAAYRLVGLQLLSRTLWPVIVIAQETMAARRKVELWYRAFYVVADRMHLEQEGIVELARIRRELVGGRLSPKTVDPIIDLKKQLTQVPAYKRELR